MNTIDQINRSELVTVLSIIYKGDVDYWNGMSFGEILDSLDDHEHDVLEAKLASLDTIEVAKPWGWNIN